MTMSVRFFLSHNLKSKTEKVLCTFFLLTKIKALHDVIDNETNDVTITHITHVTYQKNMTWVYDIGKRVFYVINK